MTRSPDPPAGHRFRLPAGTVVYRGACLEDAASVIARGMRPYKPAGPFGNWQSATEEKIRRQPAGIYVVRAEVGEPVPWDEVLLWAGRRGGTPCVWKIAAGGLTATTDPGYSENSRLLRLVSRRIGRERLLALYDCARRPCVSVSLANRPETTL
jgi:hypothetical protein